MRPSEPCRRVPFAPLLLATLAATAPAQEEGAEPEPERGLRIHGEGAFDGYTIFAPLQSDKIYMLDMEGDVVHTWKTDLAPTGAVYLLDDGHLLRSAREEDNPLFRGGGIGGRVEKFDWDGNVVWEFVLADDYQTQHHDIEPMPDGNVLLITWEHRFQEDAVEWGRDPAAVGADGLWPDAVLEIDPDRPAGEEVVWEWHSWDHVIQDFDPQRRNYGSVADHPELIDINGEHRDRPAMTEEERRKQEELERQMRALGYVGGEDDEQDDGDGGVGTGGNRMAGGGDWLHTNSIDYQPEYDLIALSVPSMSEIWVIDHSTTSEQAARHTGGRFGRGGDLLYRWGNPRTYGGGDDGDRRLFYQHDVRWLEGERPGELRVTVFNNGRSRPDGDFSSVDELVLPFDPERGFLREESAPFGPAQPAWSYSDPGSFFSSFISGAHRLPNGNTLICSGAPGRILEVTRDGRIVWEYLNPYGGEVPTSPQGGNTPRTALFRATRIARDHPGLRGRL